MATVDGRILNLSDAFSAGALFRLVGTEQESWSEEVPHALVSAERGSATLVVSLTQQRGRDGLIVAAHEAAQRALDIRSVREMRAARLSSPGRYHSLWWRGTDGVELELHTAIGFGMSSKANVTVTTPTVTLVPAARSAPPPPIGWHAAFRYFRLSQATDDLYDSYRNLFLALEALLSTFHPATRGTRERAWLEAALRAAAQHGAIDLQEYLSSPASDPVLGFIDEQYEPYRCAIFHAKRQRLPRMPEDLSDRVHVARATEHLGSLVSRLMRTLLSAHVGGGGLTIDGLRVTLETLAPSVCLTVAADGSTPPLTMFSDAPNESPWTALVTTYDGRHPQAQDHFYFSARASVEECDEYGLRRIGALGAWAAPCDNVPFTGAISRKLRSLREIVDLDLDGVTHLGIRLLCALDNPASLRRWLILS